MSNQSPPESHLKLKKYATDFDLNREKLAERCKQLQREGMSLRNIASTLNSENTLTKTMKPWSGANILALIRNPKPPINKETKAHIKRQKRATKRFGNRKSTDLQLSHIKRVHPELEDWRLMGVKYLSGVEAGLSHRLHAVNALLEFIADNSLPTSPGKFLLSRRDTLNFYESRFDKKITKGAVQLNNLVHEFIEWILSQPEFCEEDDNGYLTRSPAFRNPISLLTTSGIPHQHESVFSTLPYGYIDELRSMIAEGPNFKNWKFAQLTLGTASDKSNSSIKVTPEWFQVDPKLIDSTDPDCVWRTRIRTVPSIPGKTGQGRKKETIYEMWSPVRWVALLVKLQLPLRTFQTRMLDSGEADTWRWESGHWNLNASAIAKGAEKHPHSNGVFRKPNPLSDGDTKVILYINTNKTADRYRANSAKGYTVPWVVGGPIHQDPIYWLEKLRNWQEKYNPINRLTSWSELDGRHIPIKTAAQLAKYPDTAFLFRTPEARNSPNLPLTMTVLDRPWYRCLKTLETRLKARGETLPNGRGIQLVYPDDISPRNSLRVFFPLHSLRVSLITALAIDGDVPLAILQKIAGHSRLVMTLYYTKPGASQSISAIQAGIERLNLDAGETIIDWLANAEYEQLIKEAISISPETLRAAVPEQKYLRSPAGWMPMVDGLCLAGGNTAERDAPGCHDGGFNIGNDSAPRYAPVPGGARNCPMCRWFVTRPYFLPQLAARWNNTSYHAYNAREQVVVAESNFRSIDDLRANSILRGEIFSEQKTHKDAQRVLELALNKFDEITQTIASLTKLMERCRSALVEHEGSALIAVGGTIEFDYAIESVDSELLQVSGVCEGAVLYPDLDPGKAVLRQSQLLDAALIRDGHAPLFLTLSEDEQKLVGSALLNQLSREMNPKDPALGRYQVISLMDARKSLNLHLGGVVQEALRIAGTEISAQSAIPIHTLASSRKK